MDYIICIKWGEYLVNKIARNVPGDSFNKVVGVGWKSRRIAIEVSEKGGIKPGIR